MPNDLIGKILVVAIFVLAVAAGFIGGIMSMTESVRPSTTIASTFNGSVDELRPVLKEVAYHSASEHFYSVDDGYICLDTTVDVWNLLKKRGIASYIVIGNKTEGRPTDCADFECANHAWVVVPAPDGSEIAIETTGGYLSDDNGYYSGMRFATPHEFEYEWAMHYKIGMVY